MPTRIIREPEHIGALSAILRVSKLPLTISWSHGASRSASQNRLSHRWYADISSQMGDRSTGEVRGECKLQFGIPILKRDSEALRNTYETTLGALPYEKQLEAVIKLQIPVTSLMTSKQMTEYMDELSRHWFSQGVYLTDPEMLKYETEFV